MQTNDTLFQCRGLYVHRQLITYLWQSVFLPECYSKLSHFKVDVTLYREYKGKIPSDEFSAPPPPLSTSLEITVKTLTTLDSDIFSWFTLPSVLVKVMPVACALDLFSFRFPLEK